ncbi:hypothetical protein MRX96_044062 [Rhipicephalus microplus]
MTPRCPAELGQPVATSGDPDPRNPATLSPDVRQSTDRIDCCCPLPVFTNVENANGAARTRRSAVGREQRGEAGHRSTSRVDGDANTRLSEANGAGLVYEHATTPEQLEREKRGDRRHRVMVPRHTTPCYSDS